MIITLPLRECSTCAQQTRFPGGQCGRCGAADSMISTCAHCGESVERRCITGGAIWISLPGTVAGLVCPDGTEHVVNMAHATSHMTEQG